MRSIKYGAEEKYNLTIGDIDYTASIVDSGFILKRTNNDMQGDCMRNNDGFGVKSVYTFGDIEYTIHKVDSGIILQQKN